MEIKEGMDENDPCINTLKNIPFNEDDKVDGWVCKKEYNYKVDVPAPYKVKEFINTIETEVFDPSKPSSLASRIADSIDTTSQRQKFGVLRRSVRWWFTTKYEFV